MAISVCEPGYAEFKEGSVWDCSYDAGNDMESGLPSGSVCSSGMTNWLPGFQNFILPDGVAIKLSTNTQGEKLTPMVLEVHYGHVDEHPELPAVTTGKEGMTLRFTPSSSVLHRSALLYMDAGAASVPAHKETIVDYNCTITTPSPMTVYALSYHTHILGTRVSGWKTGSDGVKILIGTSPESPVTQYFYPREPLLLQNGDSIRMTCEYNNAGDEDVEMG